MKLQNIEATGHCGISIELNLLDQLQVSMLVTNYSELKDRLTKYQAYNALSYEERMAFPKEQRPYAPKIEELEEIAETAMKFLKKLVLDDSEKATVFED